MEKVIYQDDTGLYYVGYDQDGNPIKVYCDENGVALESIEEGSSLEVFKEEDGTFYYVAYNELGEAYKVPCDEQGNELVEEESSPLPYIAPMQQSIPPKQVSSEEAGTFVGAASAQVPPVFSEQPVKKSSGIKGIIAGILITLVLLCGGYYAYSTFIAKPVANMAGYVVDVNFTGKDGEGKAVAKITSIPDVRVGDSTKQAIVDELLANADITYSKESGLKNGDKVSVNVDVDPQEAEALGLKIEGIFKKSVTVEGLGSNSSSDSSKKESEGDKKSEEKKLEYKQVYNTGYKGLLMRTGPSQSYPAITTLFDGTPVKVLEYDGSWAKVDYNGTQGWMYTGYLR